MGPAPGIREAWHRGRRWYHVWVLAVDDVRVVARRDAVLAALGSRVVPFSARSPHVTVWVHGFEEEEAGGPPGHPVRAPAGVGSTVAIEVGGVNSFASCPFLEVRGAGLEALRAGFEGVEDDPPEYLPHLTAARYAGSLPIRPIIDALAPLRELPSLVTQAALVHGVVDAWSEDGQVWPRGAGRPRG
jgi:hypothetical protein